MTDKLATTGGDAAIIESVVIGGDLSKLTPAQRVMYYRQVCNSIGLNYLTRPFEYIVLNGKLTLYARKDAADQLRNINGVSINKPDIQFVDDLIIVTVEGEDNTGRKDAEIGVVKKTDMQGNIPNAIMKAVTKAKRRLTLSICGLGWLDETEVETIPDARPIPAEIAEGDVVETTRDQQVQPAQAPVTPTNGKTLPQLMVDAKYAENIAAASTIINKMPAALRNDQEKALGYARIYRAWRDAGKTSDEAHAKASTGEVPA